MNEQYFTEIVTNSLINSQNNTEQNRYLQPQLISNNSENSLWSHLIYELKQCKSFVWTVAFITTDMLAPLKLVLKDNEIHGEIITGTYLGFNDPAVFKELLKIPNLKVRVDEHSGFHPKGYLFNYSDYQTIYIGSSNFTKSALLTNTEWNLRLTSLNNGSFIKQIQNELDKIERESTLLTDEWIEEYEKEYVKPVFQNSKNADQRIRKIVPNAMQKKALSELQKLKDNGEDKALIVSATGTGKTYLGAFWTKNYRPQKFLFIVHREQILKKALQSFKQVIGGNDNDYGILSGNKHNSTAKYLFATVQTLSQEKYLKQFNKDAFNLIIIDEAHRSVAPSYQKIMQYFKPRFLLGMTATPERMDDKNVFANFDYNLAYEIRLRDALQENMLCPFHYIGVSDFEYQGEIIDETSSLSRLTAKERVTYILKQLEYYGNTSLPIYGLVFCSRTDEAKILAEEFTRNGHRAKALTNQTSNIQREKVIKELENGEIEYIITVDLFNEGIDIPRLNQIIMLRNTQSSIVFTQQLGRGLRKFKGKKYVTVIDFIGNYQNNYLIPIALYGDQNRDKSQLKQKLLIDDLVGVSTINFTKISQEMILKSLEKAKLNSIVTLKNEFNRLKLILNRVPLLSDFEKFGSISSQTIINDHRFRNYYHFLQKMNEPYVLTDEQDKVLEFVTKELSNGKRPHELLVLQQLIAKKQISYDELKSIFNSKKIYYDQEVFNSIDQVLSLNFFNVKSGKTTQKIKYGDHALISVNLLGYELSPWLEDLLNKQSDFKRLLMDAIDTGLLLNDAYDNQKLFTLYQKYTRKDVCRLLNWPKDVSAPLYGYRVTDQVCPIFITFNKEDENKRNAAYQNSLATNSIIDWYTRSPRHLNSPEVKKLLKGVDHADPQVRLELFVKRSDADGKDFSYLGPVKIVPNSAKEVILSSGKNAVKMQLALKNTLSINKFQELFG